MTQPRRRGIDENPMLARRALASVRDERGQTPVAPVRRPCPGSRSGADGFRVPLRRPHPACSAPGSRCSLTASSRCCGGSDGRRVSRTCTRALPPRSRPGRFNTSPSRSTCSTCSGMHPWTRGAGTPRPTAQSRQHNVTTASGLPTRCSRDSRSHRHRTDDSSSAQAGAESNADDLDRAHGIRDLAASFAQ